MFLKNGKKYIFLVLIAIAICANTIQASECNGFFVLPKLQIESNRFFIETLALQAGKIEKNNIEIKDFKKNGLYSITNVGNGNAVVVCESASKSPKGNIYLYSSSSGKMIPININATNVAAVRIKSYNNYFCIDYFDGINNETAIYQISPFELKTKIINNYGEMLVFNQQYIYYSNSDNVFICSVTNGKVVKKLAMSATSTSGSEVFPNGKCISYLSSGTFRIVDLMNQKSRDYLLGDLYMVQVTEDGKWLISRIELESAQPRIEYTGKVIVADLISGKKYEAVIEHEIINNNFKKYGDAMVISNKRAYFIGPKKMVVMDLQTGKKGYQNFSYSENTKLETNIKQRGFVDKNDVKKLVEEYETSLVEAINSNEFGLVEGMLKNESKLYKQQKTLVSNLYNKKIKEKLLEYQVKNIEATEQEGVYKAYVCEKIGIKYPASNDYTAKEFNWIYTVVNEGNKLSLSDLEKWNR